ARALARVRHPQRVAAAPWGRRAREACWALAGPPDVVQPGRRCPWVSPGLPGYGVTTATISADSAAPEPRASSSPAGAVGLAGVAAGGCGAAGPSGALCGPALNRLRAQREDGASQDLLLARAARRPPQVQPGEGFAGDDDPDR